MTAVLLDGDRPALLPLGRTIPEEKISVPRVASELAAGLADDWGCAAGADVLE